MITAIAIQNFKGIRERVEVQLKPLTLLFGPNSAGKSTILHALHYAREVFERRNLDADNTISGGDFVDLGGFRNLVHGRGRDARVVLEFALDLRNTPLPDYTDPYFGPHAAAPDGLDSLVGQVSSATVSVEIGWSDLLNRPYVRQYAVAINGVPIGSILYEPGRASAKLAFDVNHPVFVPGSHINWLEGRYEDEWLKQRPALKIYLGELFLIGVASEMGSELLAMSRETDAMPLWGQPLAVNYDFPSGISGENAEMAEAMISEIAAALSLSKTACPLLR